MRHMILIGLLIAFVLSAVSLPIAPAGAQTSPLETPRRPTPTGWHNGTPPPFESPVKTPTPSRWTRLAVSDPARGFTLSGFVLRVIRESYAVLQLK